MGAASKKRWDEGLEGAARTIAEIDHSPLRVLAGPGTGKTFVLMRRAARLLEEGTKPRRILVCTFTRTAATDLRTELRRIGIHGVSNIRAQTIHAFCFGLLWRSDVLELTGRTPRPLLEFEQRFLLEDLHGGKFGGIRESTKRLEAFSAAWARLQTEEPGWPTDQTDREFQESLLNWLRFHRAMLIGEIVPEALCYLRDNPVSPDLRSFDHVLVDEYQDLNRAEQVLLDLLSANATLSIVGDDNQSIYSFKYAHPEGITTFDQEHPGTLDINLEDCRRCPSLVLSMVKSLIENNPRDPRGNRRELRPFPENPEGEVHVVQWQSMEEEAEGIAQFIAEQIESHEVNAGRVLVLAPRRQLGYAVRDALNNRNIPAHSFFHEEALDGSPKKLDDSAAQQAFTLLTLLANREDRAALRCWCGYGTSSLGRGGWARIRQQCEQTGDSPWDVLEQLADGIIYLRYTESLVARFLELRAILDELQNATGQNLFDALFPNDTDWAEAFHLLARDIEDDCGARELFEALRIRIIQPELPTDVEYVRVMSLHKSKGLTADLVVVMGCIEGLIPKTDTDLSPVEQQKALEEQRRLFYVSITRTRNTLILSSVAQLPWRLVRRMGVQTRHGTRTHAQTITSRFLSELGPSRPHAVIGASILRSNTE